MKIIILIFSIFVILVDTKFIYDRAIDKIGKELSYLDNTAIILWFAGVCLIISCFLM